MSTQTALKTVTCRELNELTGAGSIDLIDVRTPVEFREVHSVHARNVPLDSLDPQAMMSARADADEPLYVICRSGGRAAKACEAFIAAGYKIVVNVEGGTNAWDEAGLPVIRGKKAVSLERQVRIAAGFLVFLGASSGFLYQGASIGVAGIGLSGFVGAGLMFAGITDTCAMGLLIAKMPWNQVKNEGASCSR